MQLIFHCFCISKEVIRASLSLLYHLKFDLELQLSCILKAGEMSSRATEAEAKLIVVRAEIMFSNAQEHFLGEMIGGFVLLGSGFEDGRKLAQDIFL